MSELLEIDGSVLEGGGQILRISISLSAILGIPVRVTKIRANRSKPGLAAQHLKGLQLVAKMCQGTLNGGKIGSTEIEFWPAKLKGGHYKVDIQTAGSISLLLQIALPCALLADGPVMLDLSGGTNVGMAPQIDYMTMVFLPTLKKFSAEFDLNVLKRGYFPKGGGQVKVSINPVRQLKNVDITERGTITSILGWSFVSRQLPIKNAYEMADGAKEELRGEHGNVSIECYKDNEMTLDNGSGIVVLCETSSGCVLGGAALGARGAGAGPGAAAGAALRADLRRGACLDAYAQDQVIIYMALAAGRSVIRVGEVTLHTRTAMHIVELIAKTKFSIVADGGQSLIECTGLGVTNDSVPA